MTKTWIKRGGAVVLLALAVGCGDSKRFSATAVPIAIKLREPIAKSNTSDIAGEVQRARELFEARAITQNDLRLFVLIQEHGTNNSWNDAKKILEEGLEVQ